MESGTQALSHTIVNDDDDDDVDNHDDDDDVDDDDSDEKVIQKLKAFLLTDHCMILMVRWPTKANQKSRLIVLWSKYDTNTIQIHMSIIQIKTYHNTNTIEM